MKRYIKLLPLCFFIFLSACSEDSSKRIAPLPPVQVASVTKVDIAREYHGVGNVRASASVGLIPRVAGEITRVEFKEGQEVAEGQPLLQIDPRPYEANLREKKALLAKSEAQLVKALDDRRRFGRLVGNGYVSREAYEQTATDAASLRATVQADRAAVENAALDLSYCTLRAPISGRIGSLKVDRGNMVKSNSAEPIANIDAISPCYVSFSVPEANLPVINEMMRNGPVTIIAVPVGGAPETGTLMLVENNVDEKTGTIPLRGVFENKNRNLWPGQFVNITLPLGMAKDAIIVPARAIQPGREASYVYVINEENVANYKTVHPLFETDGKIVLDGELEPGDKVVVEGQIRLSPGMKVKIVN